MCHPVGNDCLSWLPVSDCFYLRFALTTNNLVLRYLKASLPAQVDASAASAPCLKPPFQDELLGFCWSRGRIHHSAAIMTEEIKRHKSMRGSMRGNQ